MRVSLGSPRLRRWPGDNERAAAVVLGASVGGLSFVRSLARRGIPTLLLDSAREPGLASRFGLTLRLPRVAEQPESWLTLLREIGERAPHRPVLFATSDELALFASAHARQLEPLFAMLLPDHELLAALIDKRRQHELATAAGIPVPYTAWPATEDELDRAAAEISYPCALKPATSHLGTPVLGAKLRLAHDPRELRAAFTHWSAAGVELIIQEIIPGGDDAIFAYVSLRGRDGQELAAITKQKLRQNPPGYGVGSLQRTVANTEVARLGDRILRALSYVGHAGVELKRDPRNGGYRLIEVNPRSLASNQLLIAAGVDFPYVGYRYLTGNPVTPPAAREGVLLVHEGWDLKSLLRSEPNRARALATWLSTLRAADAYALAALDDPGPLIATAWHTITGRTGRLLRGH